MLLAAFTVTNTANSGTGSLSAAITSADATAGSTIDFNIPTSVSGYSPSTHTWTIAPTTASPLPAITAATTIDGTSQPGYTAGSPAVVLSGASVAGDGLVLAAGSGGSVIEGLAIVAFSGAGAHVESSNDVVASDALGTNPRATVAAAGNGVGVLVDGVSGTTIGGTTAAAGNLIGLNTTAGIQIVGATGNVVEGNLVGTSSTGANLGNQVGVQIFNSSGNTIGGTASGAANTIGFNHAQGVAVLSGDQNVVRGNPYVGTNGVATPVEANDVALGPGADNYQPAPVLIAASIQSGTLSALISDSGTTVPAGTSVVLDFYRVDASPEQRTFLASTTMTVGAAPSIVSIPATGLATTDVIAATATVPANGTSAFSNQATIEPPFMVTNTNDSGPGTLRSAIAAANAAAHSTIDFTIPTSDPGYDPATGTWTITPQTSLPTITAAGTTIDGTSQSGYTAGSPVVILSGASVTGDGLVLGSTIGATSTGSTIKGLTILGFSGAGVHVESNNDLVAGADLGIDPTGTITGHGNRIGVWIDGASGTTIGGTTAGAADVIANNTVDGVQVKQTTLNTASGNVISGNAIYADGGPGIDLVGGANGNQAAPTNLAATTLVATSGAVLLTVDGSFTAQAAGTFTLEFFAGSASGQGPAYQYLGDETVAVGAAGAVSFTETLTLASASQAGRTITATVTSPSSNTSGFGTSAAPQSPFVVTNTGDGGAGAAVGSLRQAILDADLITTGTTTISFAIPTSDSGYSTSAKIWTITPKTELPTITSAVIVDGATQPGYAGSPVIVITGNASLAAGLTATGSGGTIEGLDLVDFTQEGIDVATSNETVAGNYLGVAPDGATPGPGDVVGVLIDGSNNTIGGQAAADVIAFNRTAGVQVNSGVGNLISRNSIFSNNQGIVLKPGANNDQPAPALDSVTAIFGFTYVTGTLAGEQPNGLYLLQFFRSNTGDPATGGQAHVYLGSALEAADSTGSTSFGAFLFAATAAGQEVVATAIAIAPANTNDTSAFSNSVAAGASFVVTTTADQGAGSLRTAIVNANANPGSKITFDIPGSGPFVITPAAPLPPLTAPTTIDASSQPGFNGATFAPVVAINGGATLADGLTLGPGSDGGVIRGLDVYNVAGPGILIESNNNSIVGDYLGTGPSGTSAGPGNQTGVMVTGSINTIGGSAAGAQDVIAFNTGAGVAVQAGTGNLISRNSIFANTPQLSLLSGGNQSQPAPVITGVNSTSATGTTIIQGTVSGFTPSTTFTLEFFSSAAGDPPGAQAHQFLGTVLVTTDSAGAGTFLTTLPTPTASGQTVTATATSPFGDTSALATPVPVASPFTVTTTEDGGVGSLRQAILNADAESGSTPITISFAITGTAPYTIALQGDLPAITRPVILNATTEPGFAGTPIVQLSGVGLAGDGIVLGPGSGGSTVQGLIISGFGQGAGIHVESAGDLIAGDWLGVDPSGQAAGPGNNVGVFLDGAGANTIGGTTAGAADLIGFNTAAGVSISGGTGNLVIGDRIGATALRADVGNAVGVVVDSAGNTIGGSVAGAADVIAYSTGDGVQVNGPTATGNLISRNSIYANGGLAIDLLNGGNNAQSGQAITITDVTVIPAAGTAPAQTIVQGTLANFPTGNYTLEFFGSAANNQAGDSQANTFLISTNYDTSTNPADFSVVLPASATPGLLYSATATSALNNTSVLSTSAAATTSFVVVNSNDHGQGSLRTAITSLDQHPAAGEITFDLRGPTLISVATALPAITVPARIDGTTQPGYVGVPIVQISGRGSSATDGLALAQGSQGSVVRGLIVAGFTGAGVHVESSNDAITGNLLGLNLAGYHDGVGAWVDGSNGPATRVTIGGTAAGSGNLISGNASAGVSISGAAASGDVVLGNTVLYNAIGVAVDGAPATTIGGTAAGSANIIGLNSAAGISISGTVAGSTAGAGTTVAGNLIGTDALGDNQGDGVGILIQGSNANLIGGPIVTAGDPVLISGPGNVIAFSTLAGIEITGPAATNNVVQGNYIGTDAADDPLGNAIGVQIDSGASNNLIGGLNTTITGTTLGTTTAANTIGANAGAGVEIVDPGSTANVVEGNVIGIDPANPKITVLGNDVGVLIQGASGNTIGGLGSTAGATVSSAANVIGRNRTAGVELAAVLSGSEGGSITTSANLVEGNDVGVDQAGDKVGNGTATSGEGVLLLASAAAGASGSAVVSGNTIGGTAGAAGSNPAANLIGANFIGVEVSASLAAAAGATVDAVGNLIAGNQIGVGAAGTNLGNKTGVLISSSDSSSDATGQGAPGSTIGGTASASSNSVSGNVVGFNSQVGVELSAVLGGKDGVSTTNNVVQGNLIGTTADATGNQANGDGVLLTAGGSAAGMLQLSGNVIGGPLTTTTVGGASQNALGTAANLIAANTSDGVLVDMTGLTIPSGTVGPGADFSNTIEGNLISRNTLNGAHVKGDLTGRVFLGRIADNFIGVTEDGSSAYNLAQTPPQPQGNGLSGVLLEESSGSTPGAGSAVDVYGNLISGNGLSGLTVQSDNPAANPYAAVAVSGNIIGLDVTGETAVVAGNLPLGNVLDGVLIDNVVGVTIGGTAQASTLFGAGNVISGNLGRGVEVRGYQLASNLTAGDLIQNNILGPDLSGTQNSTGASSLGNLSDGVFLLVPPNTQIIGNMIGDNRGAGVHVATQTASNTYTANGLVTIQGNFIGTNSRGDNLFNGADGVFIDGLTPAAGSNAVVARIIGNLIAGNHANGVDLLSSSDVAVAGNTIGGTLANSSNGVFLNLSSAATIGGSTPGAGNVISGNQASGVLISGNLTAAVGNLVIGDAIGVDAAGTIAIPNDDSGVVISFSRSNTIGGTAAGAGDVISGNRLYGVLIAGGRGNGASGNILWGDMVGVNGGGTAALGNTSDGVFLLNATAEQIGGGQPGQANVISGNSGNGVRIFGAGSTNNQIAGNRVGVGSSGSVAIANQGNGILLDDAGAGNTIGGALAGMGDVISGNAQSGVLLLSDSNSIGSGTLVERNKIGVNLAGDSPVPNSANGVFIFGSAGNTIGGAAAALGNVISGNLQAGVSIYTPASTARATGDVVQFNLIGVDATGSIPIGNAAGGVLLVNASDNIIGPGDVASGNATGGVLIEAGSNGATATGNLVAGDLIGVALDATSAVPGQQYGVVLSNAVGDVIGGAPTDSLIPGTNVPTTFANLISGNQQVGVLITGNSSADLVQGNYIGVDKAGIQPIPNGQGVFIQDLSTTPSNDSIGGTTPGSGNLISGNTADGVQIQGPSTAAQPGAGSLVAGNLIGLSTLSAPLSNGIGILIQGSPSNTIGGLTGASRNVVSGNLSVGVEVTGLNASGNVLLGNYLGTNATGSGFPTGTSEAVPPQLVGVLVNGATSNTIGGLAPGSANVISADNVGVEIAGLKASNSNQITGSQNVVEGDLVGLDATGTAPVSNLEVGVFINNSRQNVVGPGDLLSANGVAGVEIFNQGSTQNLVTGNLIGTDALGRDAFPPRANQPTIVTTGVEPGIGVYAGAQLNGVVILGASNTIIGQTTTAGTGPNLIGGNVQVGVYITSREFLGELYPTPVANLVSGNQIAANGIYGVLLYDAPGNSAPPYGGRNAPLLVNSFHGTRIPFRNYIGSFDGGGRLKSPGSALLHTLKTHVAGKSRVVARHARPRLAALFDGPAPHAKLHPKFIDALETPRHKAGGGVIGIRPPRLRP